MSRYGSVLVLILAALLAGCGKGEPQYKGKPAAYWIQALKGADAQNRREAITAVGALHIKTAVPDLIAVLNDGDDQIRAKAAEALWSLGIVAAAESCRTRAQSGCHFARRQAAITGQALHVDGGLVI